MLKKVWQFTQIVLRKNIKKWPRIGVTSTSGRTEQTDWMG